MTKNFLKQYKKSKIFSNLNIIAFSLVLALAINFFIIDNINIWKNLKTSVLEAKNTEKKAQLFLETQKNNIILKNSKDLKNVKDLSFSLSYNPNNIKIEKIFCKNSTNIIKIENTPGISSFIIKYNNLSLNNNSNICKINLTKKEKKSEQINLINSNFSDNTWETFLLTTSWVTF